MSFYTLTALLVGGVVVTKGRNDLLNFFAGLIGLAWLAIFLGDFMLFAKVWLGASAVLIGGFAFWVRWQHNTQ